MVYIFLFTHIYLCSCISLVVRDGVTRLSRHVLLHFSWCAGISNISPANTVITISNIPLIKSFGDWRELDHNDMSSDG